MSAVFSRISRFFGGRGKTFIGKDLEGNRYYELPAVNGGRVKRVVEYRVSRDLADYTSGMYRLPVQWRAWLSHTRSIPPTLPELQSDFNRQSSLVDKIAEIEARETAERIRQGYLPDPNAAESPLRIDSGGTSHLPGSAEMEKKRLEQGGRGFVGVAGPSRYPDHDGVGLEDQGRRQARTKGAERVSVEDSEADKRLARDTGSQFATLPNTPDSPVSRSPLASGETPSHSAQDTDERGARQHARDGTETRSPTYSVPTGHSAGVAPPRETVDPNTASADSLRKLAEEDTKRRIEQSKGDVPGPSAGTRASTTDGAPQGAVSGGLKPRRRAKA